MVIPYKTRRILNRVGAIALAVLVVCALGWFCWVTWAERYIIYTRDGAQLDLNLSQEDPGGVVAVPPSAQEDVSIYFNEGENMVDTSKELTQLNGYYIDTAALNGDLSAIREQVLNLPAGTPVMIDVKSIKGTFYYSSEVPGATMASVDIAAMDSLINLLIHGDYYVIARVPAFRDYTYGLNNVPSGLHHTSGRYLWMDESGCYWLDPTKTSTLNYVIQIVGELKAKGFDEVVLTDFRFPVTDKIRFDGDKNAALQSAMDTIISNCASDGYTLSFVLSDPGFTLPTERSRLYLEGVSANNVGAIAAQFNNGSPEIRLVFIATTNDTRYDQYGVLRPISSAAVLNEQNQ